MTDVSWTATIGQVTTVTTYRQFFTTSYDRQNLSIINNTPTSPPQPLTVDIDGFKATWATILNPTMDANTNITEDQVMIDSLMFELGWYLRLYSDDFRDDQQSPTNLLRNFLTIPIQFYTTALQFWNASSPFDGDAPIPDDMKTVAAPAVGIWRWKAPLWTVILWIAITGSLIIASGFELFWILLYDITSFTNTAFPTLDMVSVAGVGCVFLDHRMTLADLARTEDLAHKDTFEVLDALRKRRGYLVEAECSTHHNSHVVFVVLEEGA
jgi:hypothetical protein